MPLLIVCMGEHTDDLRNVNDGDSVTLHTSLDLTFDEVEVESRTKHNSRDPEDVTVTETWNFIIDGDRVMAQVVQGLKSYEWEAEYPRHKKLYNMDKEETYGYIESVEIASNASEAKP